MSEIVGTNLTIQNPGLFQTKGSLSEKLLSGDAFVEAARATNSCDRFAYLRVGKSCGVCTSCLLRRIALRSAELEEAVDGPVFPDTRKYTVDVFNDEIDTWDQKSLGLYAMYVQANDLRHALSASANTFQAFEQMYPDLVSVTREASSFGMSVSELQLQAVKLYSQYLIEIQPLVQLVEQLHRVRKDEVVGRRRWDIAVAG